MEESRQLTSDIHHSKTEANNDCKSVNESFLTSKCNSAAAKKHSSKAVRRKYTQNVVADIEPCPEGHICHKCNSSLFADSSVFYGAQDYVPGYSRSFAKTRSTYNTKAVIDQTGADFRGNIWLGSYHY